MKTFILFILILSQGGPCFGANIHEVFAGQRSLVGDPHTLSTLSHISFGDHDIKLSQWKSKQGMQEVLQKLTMQLPEDTLAWSDGERINMHWTTRNDSHVLVVVPDSEKQMSFFLTSLRDSIESDRQVLSMHNNFKSTLANQRLKSHLIMDVKDTLSEPKSISLLYTSMLPIKILEKKLRELLKNEHWSLTQAQQPSQYFQQDIAMYALRPNAVLRLNLIDDLGQSFIYANLSFGK